MKAPKTVLFTLLSLLLCCCKKQEIPEPQEHKTQATLSSTPPITDSAIGARTKTERETIEPAENPASITPAVLTKESLKMGRNLMQSMNKERQEKEMTMLNNVLSFSPEQIEAINSMYKQQESLQNQMMDELASGKSMDEITSDLSSMKALEKHSSLDEVLNATLSEEQQEIYREYKERKTERAKEANAYKELAKMQTDVEMTDDQKDAVLQVFYDGKHTKTPKLTSDNESPFARSLEIKEQQNEQLLDELSNVLDEDQLATYKIGLDADIQRTKAFSEKLKNFNSSSTSENEE